MQALKNGIKSILRTPGKTALFALILAVLSALLSVAFCVFAAVRGYLADCDDFYRSIAVLEYVGRDYPNDMVFDPAVGEAVSAHGEELAALQNAPGVISFEAADNVAGLVEGFERKDTYTYDQAVATLIVTVHSYYPDSSAYSALIEKVLYASRDYEGKMILLRSSGMDEPGAQQPESGRAYIVTGHFFSGQSSYPWFMAEPMSFGVGEGEILVPAMTPYEGDLAQHEDYAALAAVQNGRNSACRVLRTASAEDLLPFHEEELLLREGRLFTQEEYAAAAHSAVVSDRLAALLELSIGSKFNMSLITADGDLYAELGRFVPESEEYEIVGIYKHASQYQYSIFLPDAAQNAKSIAPVTGYRLGQFRIENSKAEAFMESAQHLGDHDFRVSLYDHGYAAATEPMKELLTISVIFLAVCLLLAAAALALECHLFISRQREAAQTMLALGSGRRHVYGYFISAAVALAVPAGLIGCFGGKLLEGRVMGMLLRFAEQLASRDLRFSSSRMHLTKTLDFAPKIPLAVYALALAALLLGSAVLTLIFARGTVGNRIEKKQRREALRRVEKSAPKKMRTIRSSHLSGKLKYALLSMQRAPVRTVAVLLLAAVAALFFARLTNSLDGYRTQLETIRQNTVIKGRATDPSGQLVDGLSVRYKPARDLVGADVVSNYNVTIEVCHLRFIGVPLTAEGEERDVPEPRYPSGEFAIETFFTQMLAEPRFVQTGSVSGSPSFYFTNAESVRWFEGYGESSFLENELICAVPESLLSENGAKLGDTARFVYALTDYYGRPLMGTTDLKIAAAYIPAADERIIYSPIGSDNIQTGSDGHLFGTRERSYTSFTFELDDTSRLDELRQALEDAGFEMPQAGMRPSNIAVIDDASFLSVTHSMERQIQYVTALYYGLYVLTFIIGAVLAYLLTSSRRREIALMRALGTQPPRILANFVFEQTLLAALGLALGVLIARLAGEKINELQLILTAVFFGCWCVSALVCMLSSLTKQANASLTEPE